MNLFGLLFGWRGRVSRGQYWLAFVIQSMFAYLSYWLMATVSSILLSNAGGTWSSSIIGDLGPLDIRTVGMFGLDLLLGFVLSLLLGTIPVLLMKFMPLTFDVLSAANGLARGGAFQIDVILIAVLLVFLLPLLLSTIAVGIKRLHDRNESGWRLPVYHLGPITCGIVLPGSVAGIATASIIAALAIWLWAMADLGFRRGTVGENEHGLDPSTNS